ncbi:conserved hypothetical protein [Enhydrobacter sp. AX1]|nr:hypothetical protein [Enhydrobacter sp. AX1]VXB63081.1 conserved hypothetical protein [Enhydrobacter sp. AX1]
MSSNLFKNLTRVPHVSNADIKAFYNQLMKENHEYVVTWYGEIRPVPNKDQIKVKIHLASIFSEFYTYIEVPIEYTPKMPIGSIWLDGKSTEKLVLSENSVVSFMMRDVNIEGSPLTNIHYDNLTQKDSKIYLSLNEHYKIVRNQEKEFVFRDSNRLLIIPIADKTDNLNTSSNQHIIIHPLTFLNAHYGVSKKISPIILNHLWDSDSTDANIRTVVRLLELDYINPNCPKAVYIPDNLVIGDAVFLYYLRNDTTTQAIVKKLNTNVRTDFARNHRSFSYLNVQPYHTQPIYLACRYVKLDDDTLLCTEITGISMPQGEDIYYDLRDSRIVSEDGKDNDTNQTRHVFKPIYNDIENEDFFLVPDSINNKNSAVVRQSIKTIGEVRTLIRNQNINITEATQQGEVVPLNEPAPDNYSTGSRVGSAGKTGMLKMLVGKSSEYEKDEYGVRAVDSQYEKLLKYAQYVKNSKNRYNPDNAKVDCISLNGNKLGEVIQPISFKHGLEHTYPYSVYILRLELYNKIFYFLDCEAMGEKGSRGIAIKVCDENKFLDRDSEYQYCLRHLIKELSKNEGQLTADTLKKLSKDRSREAGVVIAKVVRYNHVSEDASNWVLTALSKF